MSRSKRIAAAFATATAAAGIGAVASSRIAPLLPAEGSSVCFAGDFDGTQALIVGWPHQTRGFVHVTRLALGLDHPRDQTPYPGRGSRYHFDWRYAFTLLMRTSEREDFRADGQCDWTQLSCFIDCDGGGVLLARRPAGQPCRFRGSRTTGSEWLRAATAARS